MAYVCATFLPNVVVRQAACYRTSVHVQLKHVFTVQNLLVLTNRLLLPSASLPIGLLSLKSENAVLCVKMLV